VKQHAVSGKSAHDARIVAAMIVHGIERLVTFNVRDFKRYEGIIIITLAEPKSST
jgi:predicted nucleic acid-binding protein